MGAWEGLGSWEGLGAGGAALGSGDRRWGAACRSLSSVLLGSFCWEMRVALEESPWEVRLALEKGPFFRLQENGGAKCPWERAR